jgi:hypothetical protein
LFRVPVEGPADRDDAGLLVRWEGLDVGELVRVLQAGAGLERVQQGDDGQDPEGARDSHPLMMPTASTVVITAG